MPTILSAHAVGIDIGDTSVKAAMLDLGHFPPWHPPVHLTAWAVQQLAPGIVEGGLPKNPAALGAALRSLLDTALPKPIRVASAVIGIPDAQCFIKTDLFPASKFPERAAAVRERAARDLPIALDEAALQFESIGPKGPEERVMYGAVATEAVAALARATTSALLVPASFEPEPIALGRAVEPFLVDPSKPYAILDLGAVRTGLTVIHQGAVLFSLTLPIGGASFTERIAERARIDPERAESLKRSCGLDPARCESKLQPLVTDIIAELVAEVRKGITYLKHTWSGFDRLHEILLVGGGANIKKLDAILSHALFVKVRRTDPASPLTVPKTFPAELGPELATAIGLARASLPGPDHFLRLPRRNHYAHA